MATQIINQATLTYQYGNTTGAAVSNIATATLQEALNVAKSSLDTDYQSDGDITYVLTVTNNGVTVMTNITVADDLGTYTPTGTAATVTPLTYTGPAQLYIQGAASGTLNPVTADDSITFTIPNLPAGETAMILYKARANLTTPLEATSTITNTVTVTAGGLTETATHTLPVADYADLEIVKSMTPDTVQSGGTLTYNFTLYNYGNTAATNVVLRDAFTPAPTNLAVTVDGAAVGEDGYNYDGGVFTLTGTNGTDTLTVPAATFTRDPGTGAVAVTPGVVNVTVSGTVV